MKNMFRFVPDFSSKTSTFWQKTSQLSILSLLAVSVAIQPNVLAQNTSAFNISVYNNVINGDDSSQPLAGDNAKRNVIFGKGGDDRVNAGSGGDLVFGNAGRDAIYGGKGGQTPDYIFGGKGLDYLYGGTGGSTIYTDLDGALVWGGAGVNNIYAVPVNRPSDPVYPITYVKTGPQSDNVFVELPDPSERNGMIFLHNAKAASDNLTFDNRYTLQSSCFIDSLQNNQNIRWNFHVLTTNTSGQKIGVWVLGNFNPPKFAPVSIRTYSNPVSTVNPTVATATQDAFNLANEFKIPNFDLNSATSSNVTMDSCNNRSNSTNVNKSTSVTGSSLIASSIVIGRGMGNRDMTATLSYENNSRKVSWEIDTIRSNCKNIDRSYLTNENNRLVIHLQRENPQGRDCSPNNSEFTYKNSEITNINPEIIRQAIKNRNFEVREEVSGGYNTNSYYQNNTNYNQSSGNYWR